MSSQTATDGMFPQAERVPVNDRWAIIAYLRALQLSQNATLSDLPKRSEGTGRAALIARRVNRR